MESFHKPGRNSEHTNMICPLSTTSTAFGLSKWHGKPSLWDRGTWFGSHFHSLASPEMVCWPVGCTWKPSFHPCTLFFVSVPYLPLSLFPVRQDSPLPLPSECCAGVYHVHVQFLTPSMWVGSGGWKTSLSPISLLGSSKADTRLKGDEKVWVVAAFKSQNR